MADLRFILTEETYALRHVILRPNHPIEAGHFPHDDDPETFHYGVFSGVELRSIGSFYRQSSPAFKAQVQYQIRGMATRAEDQGKGFGAKILQGGLKECFKRGADLVWCNARQKAFPFYEKFGFQHHGEIFQILDIGPHRIMFLVK